MAISPTVGNSVASAAESGSSVKTAVAVAAFKSAMQSQAAVLQLFDPANAVPPLESGRGQNVNTAA